ncbi:MAG: glycosyl hydrolase 53 family protein [Lachnospiraceae bacterium]|nr:glycosyl hydrolase 53 family protein [Lachnospiraceae bacterium]
MRRNIRYYMVLTMIGVMIGVSGCGSADNAAVQTSGETGGDAGEEPSAVVLDEKTMDESDMEEIIYELPMEPEEAEVYVEPIENLPDDFIRGVDISSVLAEEESGVVYYNEDGGEQDIFETLAENGVNYVRVRVWNDPYDENGNSYGGGGNDTAKAAEIGKRAAKYGIKLCVDYHYSDFWADPSKQMCPKAWEGMEIEAKSEALRQFTEESLMEIINAGGHVGMVQIGNEINNGIAGETDWTKRRQLLQAGSAAVREVSDKTGSDIQIAVHFTDVSDQAGILSIADKLQEKEIDYDIFAVSYYPFWHGTTDNLTETLKKVSETYDKKVLVAENSYPYTTGDGDGSGNSIGEADIVPGYPATVQGQANEIRDVCAAVAAVGDAGLGYFYWEPAWLPVGVWEEGAADADQVLAANKEIWEQYGSGWASSYAAEYDPKDAGVYYGGSSWDNQALFDYTGQPLASLKTFLYLHCGTIVDKQVESIPVVEVNVSLDAELEMPQTADVLFNDRTVLPIAVEWDAAQLAAIDTSIGGDYDVTGRFVIAQAEDSAINIEEEKASGGDAGEIVLTEEIQKVLGESRPMAHVSVSRMNLLANSSFEEDNTSVWEITGSCTDFQNKASDAYSGDFSLHFWSSSEVTFTVQQTVTGLEPGIYEFGMYIQGGDAGDKADMYIYADNGTDRLTEATGVTSWCVWQNPVIEEITVGEDGTLTVGASVSAAANAWGTLDDFYLYQK